jgi:hypothetical protein
LALFQLPGPQNGLGFLGGDHRLLTPLPDLQGSLPSGGWLQGDGLRLLLALNGSRPPSSRLLQDSRLPVLLLLLLQ